MMLFKPATSDPKLHAICQGKEIYMYPGQHGIQMFLVVIGVLMIPVMLFGKPVYKFAGKFIIIIAVTTSNSKLNI